MKNRHASPFVSLFVALAGTLAACGPMGPGDGVRLTPTNGSAMVLTPDDQIAVSVQRDAHVVTVFRVDPTGATTTLTQLASLDVSTVDDAAPEPWSAVVGNDGDTAYVILRHAQKVIRISHLHTAPVIDGSAPTGSEPTGIAITPSGRSLYVANWNEGTLTHVRTADMSIGADVDLNGPLFATGRMGSAQAARPGLAHPRGIVITDDGDGSDDNETAYVTEFFSQALLASEPMPMNASSGLPAFDQSRVGLVYAVSLGAASVSTITVAAVENTHIADGTGRLTGCYPNQLQAPALHNHMLYVASTCASPEGPVGPDATENNFRTLSQPVVFVIDTDSNTELSSSHMVLSAEFSGVYDTLSVADDAMPNDPRFNCDGARRRVPLLPSDIAFVPGRDEFYLSAYGADAVFHVALGTNGRLDHVGGGPLGYIELGFTADQMGHLPIGLAVARSHTAVALVGNANSRNVEVLDLASQAVVRVATAATPPPTAEADVLNQARRFFVTGVGRWGFHAQGWSSCESCHPDGLSDGVTWFFARGPRQSPSLAGTYNASGTSRKLMSWTASFDEIQDLESITRRLQGGVGAIVSTVTTPSALNTDRIAFEAQANGASPTGPSATASPQDFLNGSTASISGPTATGPVRSQLAFYDYLQHYISGLRAPRAPVTLAASDVAAGGRVFASHGCAGCHGSDRWTVSNVFYAPGEALNNPDTGLLRTRTYQRSAAFPASLNPPSAAGPAPYRFPDRASSGGPHGLDQINCALRAVGTYPTAPTTGVGARGVAPPELPVFELRQDMSGVSQGSDGFNPPSLLGTGSSAPYFHAGNARTLEELLTNRLFDPHRNAFGVQNLSPEELRQLVTYLLTIEKSTTPVAIDPQLDLCGSGPTG